MKTIEFKTPYEFVLKINDNIICQRYFNIEHFNPKSLETIKLKYAIDEIVYLIDEDLVKKTREYLYKTCTTFADPEQLHNYQKKGYYTKEVYIEPDKEFVSHTNTTDSFLIFSFLVNEKEVISKGWSANSYPSFIRKNIDLSNRNKYEDVPDTALKYEQTLVKSITNGHPDLIPKIINILCDVCSL